jgi:hypothetical protein
LVEEVNHVHRGARYPSRCHFRCVSIDVNANETIRADPGRASAREKNAVAAGRVEYASTLGGTRQGQSHG